MAETEFIIRDLVFKYEGLFNLNDVYKNIKSLLKKNLSYPLLNVKFESTIEYDYQEKWSGKSIYSKFFRDIYDKYVMGYKQDKLAKQIKEETYIVFNNLRDSLI